MKEYVDKKGQSSAVLDLPHWLGRMTLDIIGISEAALSALKKGCRR